MSRRGAFDWYEAPEDRVERLVVERDRYRELLVEVLEFTERHVSVGSPWTREVREALGLPAAPFDGRAAPTPTASAPRETGS